MQAPNKNIAFPLKNYDKLCFLKNIITNPNIIVGDYTYYDDFEEESLDMEQVVELPIWDFLLGTKISIDSPYSGKFKVTVPECTKPGTRLKVKGKGKTAGKKAGDLYLKLDARMPNKLTEKQKSLLAQIL